MRALHETRLEQGWEVARTVIRSLRSSDILRATYPALFERGVAQGSLHSYMSCALLLLGDRVGYSAVFDCPIFDRLDSLLLGEGAKRPDSIWFERGTEAARVLIEFEGYGADALERKARNLVLMGNACAEDVYLLVLMYWTVEVRALAELRAAYELCKRGFSTKGSRFGPAPCPILLLETIVGPRQDRLVTNSFVAKQFVFGGDDKRYIVEDLNAA